MAPFKNTAYLEFCEDADYKLSLADQLCGLRKQGLYCDISLEVTGKLIPAHKNVLVAKSDYFAAMFNQNFCEQSAAVVDMSHVFPSANITEIILDYIYTGKIRLGEDTIDEVLQTANHLLLEPLGKHCAQYLLSNLAPQNCVHTWALADAYNMTELACIAKAMTKSRLQDSIIEDIGSLQIPGHFLLRILKEAMPDIINIEKLLRFLKRWSQADHKEDCFEILEQLLVCYPDFSHHLTKFWIDLKRETINDMNTASANENNYQYSSIAGTLPDPTESTTEVLLSYKVASCSTPGDTRINCYAYHPGRSIWLKLGTVCTSIPILNLQAEPVGLANGYLVYNVKTYHHRFLAMSLINTENEVIPYPERHNDNVGLVTYKPFCFNQKLFCIVEDERRIHPHQKKAIFREADFITARNLLVHDPESNSWRFCCQIPLQHTYDGQQAALDYHIIDSGDVAYMWAMDMYWHEGGPGGGPFWMKLSPPAGSYGDKFMYCVTVENGPPVTSQEWGYKQVKLLGSGDTIYVYGYSHHCNMCTPMFAYNKETNMWSTQEELVIHYPHIVLPLHGDTFTPEAVHISQKCDVQSLGTGLIFHLEDLCPFVSKFWALDLINIEWKELPAPPVSGLKFFISCNIHNSLLMRAEIANYEDFVNATEGPLLRARLPDSASCFVQVAPSESSESEEEEPFLLERGNDYTFEKKDRIDVESGDEDDSDYFYDAFSDLD